MHATLGEPHTESTTMCVYWRQRFWPIWSFWTENAETITFSDAFLELSDSFASDVMIVALSVHAVSHGIERALLASLRSAQQAYTRLLLTDAEFSGNLLRRREQLAVPVASCNWRNSLTHDNLLFNWLSARRFRFCRAWRFLSFCWSVSEPHALGCANGSLTLSPAQGEGFRKRGCTTDDESYTHFSMPASRPLHADLQLFDRRSLKERCSYGAAEAELPVPRVRLETPVAICGAGW